MNEGRAELQRVILQYEKQRAEAIRSKQEAEIVLPFVRAAMEELAAALGQSESSETKRVQAEHVAERSAAKAAAFQPQERPRRSGTAVFGVSESHEPVAADPDFDELDVDEEIAAPMQASGGFGRASIASLIEDAKKKEHKVG